MEYNELIKKYEYLIQFYTNKYYKGIMPKEDFSQELRIKLWQRIDTLYCSSLGKLDNFARGVLSLESKKMRSDIKAQDRFEESMFTNEFLDCPVSEETENEWRAKVIDSFTQDEIDVFLAVSGKVDSSIPIRYSHIASSLGINIYQFNKTLSSIRSKIKVYIDNPEYF